VISIVDDDEGVRTGMQSLMRSTGFEAETFGSAEAFLDSGMLKATQCLILDVRLPGMSGLELQAMLHASGVKLATIFVTAHADDGARAMALAGGALAFLLKPVGARVLLAYLSQAPRSAVQDQPTE
jgi:FixJ family two-component response regulator